MVRGYARTNTLTTSPAKKRTRGVESLYLNVN